MSVRLFIYQADSEGSLLNRYTIYSVSVYSQGYCFRIRKRYSEFLRLHRALLSKFPRKECLQEFPKKCLFPMSKEIVESRLKALNALVGEWTSDEEICRSEELREFAEILSFDQQRINDPIFRDRSNSFSRSFEIHDAMDYEQRLRVDTDRFLSRLSHINNRALSEEYTGENLASYAFSQWKDLPKPMTPPCLRNAPILEATIPSNDNCDSKEVADQICSSEFTSKNLNRSIGSTSLPFVSSADNDVVLCPILARPMYDAIILVPCGHSFSEIGITQWMDYSSSSNCPTCRSSIYCKMPNYSLRSLLTDLEKTPLSTTETS